MEIMLQGIENRIRIEFVESDVPNTKMICCFRFRDDTKEAKLMTDKELQWLNDYHETVRQRLTPLIKDGAVKEWLADATKPISR